MTSSARRHYGTELQHLNLNGVQHISIFVAFYEGFLGVEPSFVLWCHFFSASLHRRKIGNEGVPATVACVRLRLKSTCATAYISVPTLSTHHGWHSRWFYLRNDEACPFPAYTGCAIDELGQSWKWGVSDADRAWVEKAVTAITHLKEWGLDGTGLLDRIISGGSRL